MMRPRNRLYHRYILDQMKVEATGEGAVISAAERAAIMGFAHRLGLRRRLHRPALRFRRRRRLLRALPADAVHERHRHPDPVLAAFDDPWIPGRSIGSMIGPRIRRSHRFCLTVVAMSASMAAAAASRGATSW